jgi:hypothetical protein
MGTADRSAFDLAWRATQNPRIKQRRHITMHGFHVSINTPGSLSNGNRAGPTHGFE